MLAGAGLVLEGGDSVFMQQKLGEVLQICFCRSSDNRRPLGGA